MNQKSPHELFELLQRYGSPTNTLVNTPLQTQSRPINMNCNISYNPVVNGWPILRVIFQVIHRYHNVRARHPSSFILSNCLQMILDKLESMNKKLSKLDNIETEVKRISRSVTAHDSRQTIEFRMETYNYWYRDKSKFLCWYL